MRTNAVLALAAEEPGVESMPGMGGDWLGRELLVLGVLFALLAAQIPLFDPDLPMHLALGEWIVRHRAVPFQEPFAWTREGAPFYAYSWLPEVVFYSVHATFGPAGLRLLQGVLLAGVGGAVAFLGRCMGWRSGTTMLLAALSILVAGLVVPALRPQIAVAILMPVIWGLCWRAVHDERLGLTPLWLLLASALFANSHLFFVLGIAPLALFWIRDRWSWRRVGVVGAAIVGGWLLSPYALVWPAVIRTNLGHNAMLAWPSPIGELRPGFLTLRDLRAPRLVPVLTLLLAPWAMRRATLTAREQIGAVAFWVVGLVGFGQAVRLLLVWWVLFLPFLSWALRAVTAHEIERPPRRAFRWFGYAALLGLAAFLWWREREEWTREGTVRSRTLATGPARPSERVADWLEANLRAGTQGRLYTIFNFGSYLTWRLPMLSESIDGRTIFPDSVARVEAFIRASKDTVVLGPWRSADLAIVRTRHPVAAVLDTATGWRRIAVSAPVPRPGEKPAPDSVGLWVRESWWRGAGRTPLPRNPVFLPDSAGATE